MKRILIAACAAFLLPGCNATSTQPVPGPSGNLMRQAKCSMSPDGCMREAAKQCKGTYQVLDSSSNAGGLVADILPGPVTWYRMSYQCGKTDGRMPTFAFRGQNFVPPPVVMSAPTQPRIVNCTSTGTSTFVGGAPRQINTTCY